MRRSFTTTAVLSAASILLGLSATPAARADDPAGATRGDHPAIVVQRLHKAAGYDYASHFYRHPAGLDLYATAPTEADPADAASAAAERAVLAGNSDGLVNRPQRGRRRDGTVTAEPRHDGLLPLQLSQRAP